MISITLDDRLLSAAEYVRQDAHLADIGTDHALLPIFLLESGRVKMAHLADINEGPLAAARENVNAHGLTDSVVYHLTDGCAALSGLGITDYTVCGMGGELIAAIIDRAPHLKDPSVRLILQPMSRQSILRRYLAESGFRMLSERYTYAAGKYYVTILAEYSGEGRVLDFAASEIGAADEIIGDEAYLGYLKGKLASFCRERDGKLKGGSYQGELDLIIPAIENRIAEYEAKH